MDVDSGQADAGPEEGGLYDVGLPDTNRADTGPADADPEDAGPNDVGLSDTGQADTAPMDIVIDTALDSWTDDDGGAVDDQVSTQDGSVIETQDAAEEEMEEVIKDGGTARAGIQEASGGCGCTLAADTSNGLLLWPNPWDWMAAVVALLLLRVRRRSLATALQAYLPAL